MENKNKGFTLIELLAVIAILGIVGVIIIPAVNKTMDNSRKNTFATSARNMMKVAKVRYQEHLYDNPKTKLEFTYNNGRESSNITGLELEYNGNSPESGSVVVNKNGDVTLAIHDGKYCAQKTYKSNEIIISKISADECILPSNYLSYVYGGTNADEFNGVTYTEDGYVAVGVSSSNNNNLSGLHYGGSDATIVKYDLKGNILWNKNFGGSDAESFSDVITINDGFIAVGYSCSNDVYLTGLHKGGCDAILVKYDSKGEIIWNKNFGGTAFDNFRQVIAVNDGYVAVGDSSSNNGDLSGLSKGSTDAIIVKFDLNGNLLWKKVFGGSGWEYFLGVTATPDGSGYIVVGNTASKDKDLVGLSNISYPGIIVKYDLNGNVIWMNYHGEIGEYNIGMTDFNDVTALSDGYIVVGIIPNFDVDHEIENDASEYYYEAIKYDLNGQLVWKKAHNKGTKHFNYSKVITTDNGYVTMGYEEFVFWPDDVDDIEYYNTSDRVISSFDLNGNHFWTNRIGEWKTDNLGEIDEYSLITGSFTYFNDITNVNNGYAVVGFKTNCYGECGQSGYDAISSLYDINGEYNNN